MKTTFLTLALCAIAGSSYALDLGAVFSCNDGLTTASYTVNGAHVDDYVGTIYGTKVNGGDTLLGSAAGSTFVTYCGEYNQPVYVPAYNYYSNVSLLGGASSSNGIDYNATRTAAIQRLWGAVQPTVGTDITRAKAFQLAQWNLVYDNDYSLLSTAGSGFYVGASDWDAAATIAEGFLATAANPLSKRNYSLVLLSDAGAQDLIGTKTGVEAVPEPASMTALAVGVAAIIRRRRKN